MYLSNITGIDPSGSVSDWDPICQTGWRRHPAEKPFVYIKRFVAWPPFSPSDWEGSCLAYKRFAKKNRGCTAALLSALQHYFKVHLSEQTYAKCERSYLCNFLTLDEHQLVVGDLESKCILSAAPLLTDG